MSAAWPVLTTRKKIGMNIVMNSASGWRIASRSERRPECERGAHAATSWTSPAARSRVRPVASRKTSSSVGSSSPPRRRRRSALSAAGRALAHDQAVVDDRDAVAELVGLLEVLRREEDRRALAVDPAQLLPDRQPAGRVEAGGRLVEEQDLGLVHERRREVEPALHAAGVALDHAVGGVLELDQLEQLLRPARVASAASSPNSRPCRTSSSRPGLARVEAGLLQRDADPAAGAVGVARRRRRPRPRRGRR